MAQPTPYNKNRNFSSWQASNPNTVHEGSALDAEFDDIEQTLDETLANLALIQRDDGKLKNSSVHPDSLSTATKALIASDWTPKGLWATATDYVVGDLVEESGSAYVCAEAHTSGTFATDHTAGKWIVLNDVTRAIVEGLLQGSEETFAVAGGTADALTAAFTPTLTSLTNGMIVRVQAAAANATTTPTLNPDGQGAKTIVKNGGQALVAGDIFGAGHVLLLVYRESADVFELLNPGMTVTAFARTILDDADASTVLTTLGFSAFIKSFIDDADVEEATSTLTALPEVADVATLRELDWANGRRVWLRCHTTAGDGGHGVFRRVTGASAGTYTHDGGVILVASAGDGSAAWIREFVGNVHVAWYGASASATGAVNSAAIQAAMDYVLANGGRVEMEKNTVYTCASALDFRQTVLANRELMRSIQGNFATLDFSASGLTTGSLLRVGADDSTKIAERTWSDIENLRILGPEDDEDIIPESSYRDTNLGGGTATVATSVIGVNCEYAVKTRLKNVYVSHVSNGFEFFWCWDAVYENIQVNKALIGYVLEAACTHITWIHPVATFCTYPFVFNPVGVALSNQTIIGPRIEDCTIGFHLDPGSTGSEIRTVHIINPYMEDVYRDGFRVGIEFVSGPGQASTRGADRAGKIASFVVDGGQFIGDGVSSGFGADRKAFYFASTANVASGHIMFTCSTGEISNLPPAVGFHGLVRVEDIATQTVMTVMPGRGRARINDDGTVAWNDGGLISGASKVATGVYDVALKKALVSSDAASIQVSNFGGGGRFAEVVSADSTASSIRVRIFSDSGIAADSEFSITVDGELAAL